MFMETKRMGARNQIGVTYLHETKSSELKDTLESLSIQENIQEIIGLRTIIK